MPRTARFDRERINKLFGRKEKLIKKRLLDATPIPFLIGDSQKKTMTTPFSTSNYVTFDSYDKRRKIREKLKFRCYGDEGVYDGEVLEFLKYHHDGDAESTSEQIRADVNRGISKLKE